MVNAEFRLVRIWLVLIALTLLSFGANARSHHDLTAVTIVVIVSALMKVRFVMLDFMEARGAPWMLRLFLEGWIIILAAVLLREFD